MLLEKGYAKLYGSFDRIQSGNVKSTVRDLTGVPVHRISHDSVDAKSLLTLLQERFAKGYNPDDAHFCLTTPRPPPYLLICASSKAVRVLREQVANAARLNQ